MPQDNYDTDHSVTALLESDQVPTTVANEKLATHANLDNLNSPEGGRVGTSCVRMVEEHVQGSYLTLWTSFFSWVTLYFTLCLLNPKRNYEWHCRLVTTLHAIVITSLAAWCAFVEGPWPFTDAGGPNTPTQLFTVTVCFGYFLFDFLWCLYFQTEDTVMLVHHSLSLVGLGLTFLMGKYGTEMVATICGAELTNPLLQLRWFLREMGRADSVLAEIVDHAFMISFGLLRIGVGSALLYCYFQQPTDLLGRFGGVVIYTIGWIFWISIVQYAIKKYKKKFKAWKFSKNNGTDLQKNNTFLNTDGKNTTTSRNGCRSSKDNETIRNSVNGYIRGVDQKLN
ncbi:hypothetical protein ScPMuIL_002737 [Solemya velum]